MSGESRGGRGGASGTAVGGGAVGGRVLGAGTPARPAAWPAMVAALTGQELRLAARRGENLLAQFVIPAGTLVVLSALDLGGSDPGGKAVDRALPASIALAVIAAALVSLGIATAYERSYGVLKRLGGSPAGTSVLVTSKTAGVIVVEAIQVVLLVAIAAGLLGWSPGPSANAVARGCGLLLGHGRLRRTRAAARRHAPGRGDARPREPAVRARPGHWAGSPCRWTASRRRSGRWPPPCRPRRSSKSWPSGSGAPGDASLPLAILAGWAVLLAGLAVWRFRWD